LNIAFPAVLIILLALPGVIFNRYRSVSGRFRSQRQILDELLPSLGAATVAHLAGISVCYLISGWTGLRVDFEAVLLLVAGRLGEQSNSVEAIKAASCHPLAVFSYFFSLLLACYCAGWLDGKLRVWRHGPVRALTVFSAEDESQARRFAAWARILSTDLPDSEIACTTIVASLTVGSKSYLYAGLLRKVFWNESTGEPEWLQLWSTLRRDIAADGDPAAKTPDRWYEVEGESFMIRFSEVGTLNLIYTAIEESDKNSESPTPNRFPLPHV
jgi:hypothetical protein